MATETGFTLAFSGDSHVRNKFLHMRRQKMLL